MLPCESFNEELCDFRLSGHCANVETCSDEWRIAIIVETLDQLKCGSEPCSKRRHQQLCVYVLFIMLLEMTLFIGLFSQFLDDPRIYPENILVIIGNKAREKQIPAIR